MPPLQRQTEGERRADVMPTWLPWDAVALAARTRAQVTEDVVVPYNHEQTRFIDQQPVGQCMSMVGVAVRLCAIESAWARVRQRWFDIREAYPTRKHLLRSHLLVKCWPCSAYHRAFR